MSRETRDHDLASVIHGSGRLLLQSLAPADALGRMRLRSWNHLWQIRVAADFLVVPQPGHIRCCRGLLQRAPFPLGVVTPCMNAFPRDGTPPRFLGFPP